MPRARYVWAALAVSLLAAAGFYATRGAGTGPVRASAGLDRLAPGPAGATGSGSRGSSHAPAAPGPCGSPDGTPCSLGSARITRMPATVAAASGIAGAAGAIRATRTASPSAAPGNTTARPVQSPAGAPAASVPNQQGSPADQVLALINQARAQAGLPALTFSADLDHSASAHNLRMAGGCGLSHQCQGEPPIGARETAAGVHWTASGENIGEAGPEPGNISAITQAAVGLTQDMLNEKPPDDGHRRNILSSSFGHIGIAVYEDGSGTVWMTQDFSN